MKKPQRFDRQKSKPRREPAPVCTVQIEKPVYGGNFLARQDGKAIFVPFAMPGEQVRVQIVEDKPKRGFAVAELDEVMEASPVRVEPRCQHFGPCGGCHYQHAGYATQLEWKQAVLRETLERAGIAVPAIMDVLSAEPWAYRNRIRVAFDAEGRPGYRGRRSHQVVAIRECPISAGLLVHAALECAEVLRAMDLRAQELALFCDAAESRLLATLFVNRPWKVRAAEIVKGLKANIPELAGLEIAVQAGDEQASVMDRWGEPSIRYEAAAMNYRVDHGSFFQVNRWLLDCMVDRVTDGLSGKLAWDLFAGVGLFARQLALKFDKVVAVESVPLATPALAANLAGTSGEGVASSTLDFLRAHTDARPDAIVVDPPRTGLGPEISALLCEADAPTLVYVSCDPATLARDLRVLCGCGYRIESVAMVDLFPQTFHLESVVRLCRS